MTTMNSEDYLGRRTVMKGIITRIEAIRNSDTYDSAIMAAEKARSYLKGAHDANILEDREFEQANSAINQELRSMKR